MPTPIQQATALGHSIWYDNLRRGMFKSGELAALVIDDGLRGMTSNPAIFEKAIGSGSDYDEGVRDVLGKDASLDDIGVFEHLAISDIQGACDVLRPVFDESDGLDGYVSLEVSPRLAHDTDGTIAEAKRLHAAVARPNLMIKVPGTKEGVPAVRALIAAGISINVTLLFAVDAYLAAADAYIAGLEDRAARGEDISKISGVASFFLSRIDSSVDKLLEDLEKIAPGQKETKSLHGKAAIANAKVAYSKYQELVASPRWQALAGKGANPQRLLWASTGTKNPAYDKLMYVEALIGPDTVDTVPTDTYNEFRARGTVASTLGTGLDEAKQTLAKLGDLGISLTAVTDKLLDEGVKAFEKSFDTLLAAVADKRKKVASEPAPAAAADTSGDRAQLGQEADTIASVARDWAAKVPRIWSHDATVWTGHDEGKWLGWLDAVAAGKKLVPQLAELAAGVKADGLQHAIVLGMGGSSLCPWVFVQTFGTILGAPKLHVLDSIIPAQILAAEAELDLHSTLFIVSSKSGSTTEPNVMLAYFMDRVRAAGVADPAKRFVAITDPGSKLEAAAKAQGFRAIISGDPAIGGRYSALSPFGLVPAAVMGLDVAQLLDRAGAMAEACKRADASNPGVALGAAMGTLAKRGRDKLTIVASPKLRAVGAWLEQLIAESTGKQGTGVIPVDGEKLAGPGAYGDDRFFVYVGAHGEESDPQVAQLDALAQAGHPVMRLAPIEPLDLGALFFRWEFATAVAGGILGIDPFDQPDVEASKIATRRILASNTPVSAGEPIASDSRVQLYADAANTAALGGQGANVADVLAKHLARAGANDYVAINAYLVMDPTNDERLQALRHQIRDARHVATTLGYGPRFLHSTGQLHKGGPASGVFLQLTADAAAALPVPGETFDFGQLARAQAQGDFEVLSERGRRALRVHLGTDVGAGLLALKSYLDAAFNK